MSSGLAKYDLPSRLALGNTHSKLGYNIVPKDEHHVRPLSMGLRSIAAVAATATLPNPFYAGALGYISISTSTLYFRAFIRAAMSARRRRQISIAPAKWQAQLHVGLDPTPALPAPSDTFFVSPREVELVSSKFSVLPDQSSQGRIHLSGSFSPSRKLTSYWARGVESFRPKNITEAPKVEVVITSDIQSEFTRFLKAYIGSIGQQRRYSNERNEKLTYAGRLSPFVQTEICDRFQIIPDEAHEFISLLIQELRIGISEGVQISGAWGALTVDESNDIRFSLSNPRFIRTPGFTKSTEVE